tara:strand:+ start:6627 stop:7388 length:762 start_codon:yes stop_codon:yes gene_type:complete
MKQQEITVPENWEQKDRVYTLKGSKSPLTRTIPSKHTTRYPMTFFDTKLGYQRELKYASNQPSVFVDEQNGPSTLSHIVFRDGVLNVPKENQALQILLSNYHPFRDKIYSEFDPVVEAKDELNELEIELAALNLANQIDVDHQEAILRVEMGSDVRSMTAKQIKRDILLFAKRRPRTFIALAQDENIQLRNFGIHAVEQKILKLSNDQKTFSWAKNGKKIMTVPFDEHPYSALASFFKTDEGMEVFKSIEKKL